MYVAYQILIRQRAEYANSIKAGQHSAHCMLTHLLPPSPFHCMLTHLLHLIPPPFLKSRLKILKTLP